MVIPVRISSTNSKVKNRRLQGIYEQHQFSSEWAQFYAQTPMLGPIRTA